MQAIAFTRHDAAPQPREMPATPALTALRNTAWFSAWAPASLSALSVVGSLRSFGAGQVIAAAGKAADTVAVVVKGRVRVVHRGEGGREVTLEAFRAGTLCLDSLFEAQGTLSNDWIAAETSLLLFLPRDEFMSHVRTSPDAALTLARDFERRLARAKTLTAELALSDVQSRLYRTLATLAREEGEASPEGQVVRKCPTQQELGNMIGACRETVSRIIAELGRQGLVISRGRRLTITPQFLAMNAATAGEA